MAQPKTPKTPSRTRNPGASIEQLPSLAKPTGRTAAAPNGSARRNGRHPTHNGVGEGSHPQSFRQLLRKGKENGHVEVDYLCFETMAEATVSAAQVRKRRDPSFPGLRHLSR